MTALVSLVAQPSFSAERLYEINLDIEMKGKSALALSAFAREGRISTVQFGQGDEQKRVEVTANRATRDGHACVVLDFNLFNVDAAGARTKISSPRVLVRENQKATVSQRQTDSIVEDFSLSVVATRTRL